MAGAIEEWTRKVQEGGPCEVGVRPSVVAPSSPAHRARPEEDGGPSRVGGDLPRDRRHEGPPRRPLISSNGLFWTSLASATRPCSPYWTSSASATSTRPCWT